ncbi:MAG: hypothetical protein JRG71_03885 [Deltaproteobacteria bacterium]|nr:hypothetical protein [Deltaproteobacteria bacterium]
MKKIYCFLLVIIFSIPNIVCAETISVNVSASANDADQLSDYSTVYTNYSYLDMGRYVEGSGRNRVYYDTTVGLRFTNVTIPAGATITNAHITFHSSGNFSSDCKLSIAGQANANPLEFSTSENITSRDNTTNSVSWDLGRWYNRGDYDTPDLTEIIQEIMNNSGWINGNAMAFIISPDSNNGGSRQPTSYDGTDANSRYNAPTLHIEYEPVPPAAAPEISVTPLTVGSDAPEGANAPQRTFVISNTGDATLNFGISESASWLSCNTYEGTIAAESSATITVSYASSTLDAGSYETSIKIYDRDGVASDFDINATVRITEVLTGSVCGDVPVYTENLVSPAVLLLLDVSGSMDWDAPLAVSAENKSQTPDLSTVIQSIVSRPGWSPGNSMSFFLTANNYRVAVSRDGSTDTAPLLHIDYKIGTDDDVLTIDMRIANDDNDAEEDNYGYYTGGMDLDSTDLDFYGYLVGLRYTGLNIPNNAIITNAYLEFVIDETDTNNTDMTITGEAIDDSPAFTYTNSNLSDRNTTSAVPWNDVEDWTAASADKRINIARDVLSSLVEDRSIAWGFGTWSGDYPSSQNYTKIHVGTSTNTDDHYAALIAAIASASPDGNTPLTPSMLEGRDYFDELVDDEYYEETYSDPGCQPRMIIEITDGIGNTGTTVDNVRSTVIDIGDKGITVVGVGFGLDDASQLNALAEESNIAGDEFESDYVYALHETDANGNGVPFLANSKDELITALQGIASSLKSQVFYGAAPAATTSVDYGNIVISALFTPDDWSGDLVATEYNENGTLGVERWSAAEQMPTTINAFTIDPTTTSTVAAYSTTGLYEFYLCKPLGDIIHSTPKVVGAPAFYYSFDSYYSYRDLRRERNKLVYVGANDGALHAFSLSTGAEQWRFYPKSLHSDLNSNLVNTNEDLCYASRTPSGEYCHKYLVDGTPIVADVYDGSAWHTALVTGLGKGGSSYFALDISGGGNFGSGDDDTHYLWEFTDSELGFATSQTAIGRADGTAGAKWGAYFGSGYSSTSQQSTKESYIYGIHIMDKSPLWLDSSGSSTNRVKISAATLQNDALSSPLIVNIGDDDLEDYLYVGNLYGSMFRVANIGNGQTPTVSKLLDLGRSDHANPITGTATYAYDETAENVWLYFGTGQYEETADKTTMEQQYFFGLKDNDALRLSSESSGGATYLWNAVTNTIGDPSEALTELTTSKVTVENNDGTQSSYRVLDECNGDLGSWLLKLINNDYGMIGSERVTSKPIVIGGVVFFTTFIPDVDVCAGNGESWLYALNYKTGCTVNVFDVDGDGTADESDTITVEGEPYEVAGKRIGNGEASDLVFDGKHLWYNTTVDGSRASDTGSIDLSAQLNSWREL